MDPLGEKAPFIVTLLFAALGWGITHTVDRVLQSPIVEYTARTAVTAQGKHFVVTLRNLSQERLYKNVQIVFMLPVGPGPAQFEDPLIRARLPAWEGRRRPSAEGGSARFNLDALYPGAELELSARYTGDGVPMLQLVGGEPGFQLTKPSFATFLLDHELSIIATALGIWATMLIFLVARKSAGRGARARS